MRSLLCLVLFLIAFAAHAAEAPTLSEAKVVSSLDKQEQPVRYFYPAKGNGPRPLLVSLHSWSGDYTQDHSKWLAEAAARDWAFLEPNFRGINDHPEACGSKLARQDVLDAMDWMVKGHKIDSSRIYLAGESGGGMMTLLMAGYHPERFSAVSSWVAITDLAEWERFHFKEGMPDRYALQTVKCCGGRPGDSPEVDREYRERSPLTVLHRVGELPVDINHGVTDGKTGSVPIQHAMRAFNVIAGAHKTATISEEEMTQLWKDGKLVAPSQEDTAADSAYQREIFLRRRSGATRITIFDGGHEGLPAAACLWLEKQSRATRP
jgi:dipeptidyl aminopeptidase/acylaminoacyl peptidase